MQLQQSTFKLSHFFLSRIPRAILLLLSLIIFSMIIINRYFMLRTNHTNLYKECIEEYFNVSHASVKDWITDVEKRKKFKAGEGNEYIKFTNSSTLVRLQQSNIDEEWKGGCRIEFGYNGTEVPETVERDNQVINRYRTLGYIMSNNALFNLNLSDTQMIRKHEIHLNRIILPKITQSYRYLLMDQYANLMEEFVYQFLTGMEQVSTKILERVKANMEQESDRIKKVDQNNSSSTVAGQQKSSNAQVNPPLPIRTLQETKQDEIKKDQTTEVVPKQDDKSEDSLPVKDKDITKYFPTVPIYAGHRLMYKLDALSKWYSYEFLSVHKASTGRIIGTIWKLCYTLFCFFLLTGFFIFVGIFVRYFIISLLTVLAIIIGKRFVGYAGWVSRYINLIKRGEGESWFKRGGLKFQIGLGIVGMNVLYTIMAYFLFVNFEMVLASFDFIPANPKYLNKVLVSFLMIEFFHYIFCRSRTSLKFFPQFSMLSTIYIIISVSYNHYKMTLSYLNTHFLFNILLMLIFMLIQKNIQENNYQCIYKPTLDKPRMLFYLGYDLDWHRGIPPIWTQFQMWFDLSYVSEMERAYIDKNYQLLYGRLMGVNQAQQLPHDQEQEQEQGLFGPVEMSEVSN